MIFSTPTCKKFHVAARSSLLGAGGIVIGILVALSGRYDQKTEFDMYSNVAGGGKVGD